MGVCGGKWREEETEGEGDDGERMMGKEEDVGRSRRQRREGEKGGRRLKKGDGGRIKV